MPKLVLKISPIEGSPRGFDIIFEWLESVGLSFRNPAINAVTAWTENGQITTTVEAVIRSAKQRQPGSVQMWFDTSDSIDLSWTADGMIVFLDGTNAEERLAVVHAVVDKLMEAYSRFRSSWHISVGTEDEVLGEAKAK